MSTPEEKYNRSIDKERREYLEDRKINNDTYLKSSTEFNKTVLLLSVAGIGYTINIVNGGGSYYQGLLVIAAIAFSVSMLQVCRSFWYSSQAHKVNFALLEAKHHNATIRIQKKHSQTISTDLAFTPKGDLETQESSLKTQNEGSTRNSNRSLYILSFGLIILIIYVLLNVNNTMMSDNEEKDNSQTEKTDTSQTETTRKSETIPPRKEVDTEYVEPTKKDK